MYLSNLRFTSQLVSPQVSLDASSSYFMHFYAIVTRTEVKVPRAFAIRLDACQEKHAVLMSQSYWIIMNHSPAVNDLEMDPLF